MLNTIEEYIISIGAIRSKLMPLCEEAFENKDWAGKNLCATFWINGNEATHETEGYFKANAWLYVPGVGEYFTGNSITKEDGITGALKNASLKCVEAVNAIAANRKISVAKADFYRSFVSELTTVINQIN